MVMNSIELRDLADSLITAEAAETFTLNGFVETFSFSKLRPTLIELVGTGGFRAIIGSALCRAQTNTSWLRQVSVNNDGSFENLAVGCSKLSAVDCHKGHVDLLTQILIALVGAVGPIMTRAIVEDTWPSMDYDDERFALKNFAVPSAAWRSA